MTEDTCTPHFTKKPEDQKVTCWLCVCFICSLVSLCSSRWNNASELQLRWRPTAGCSQGKPSTHVTRGKRVSTSTPLCLTLWLNKNKKSDHQKVINPSGAFFFCAFLLFAIHFSSCQRNRAAAVSDFIQQVAAECGENPPWSAEQSAAVLLSMRNLTAALHKHHLRGGTRVRDTFDFVCMFSFLDTSHFKNFPTLQIIFLYGYFLSEFHIWKCNFPLCHNVWSYPKP